MTEAFPILNIMVAFNDLEYDSGLSDMKYDRSLFDFKYNGGLSDFKYDGSLSDLKYDGGLSDFKYNGGLSDFKYNSGPFDLKYACSPPRTLYRALRLSRNFFKDFVWSQIRESKRNNFFQITPKTHDCTFIPANNAQRVYTCT